MALKGLHGVHEGGGLQGALACLSYQAVTASQRCSLNGPRGKQGSQHLSALQQRRGGVWGVSLCTPGPGCQQRKGQPEPSSWGQRAALNIL